MKIAATAVIVYSISAFAQEPRTGVSTPPPMTTDGATSAGASESTVIDGYRPTPASPVTAPTMERREVVKSEARLDEVGAMEAATRPVIGSRQDVDAQIVTGSEHAANECPAGTMLKARMQQTLSTASTAIGTPFSAELTEPIMDNGRVLIPAGSVLDGRVTEVRGGKRIRGTAALHLEPRKLTLPDGTRYDIRGQVIDTSESFATRIDSEGTIVRRDHIKATLAGMGLATGGGCCGGSGAWWRRGGLSLGWE